MSKKRVVLRKLIDGNICDLEISGNNSVGYNRIELSDTDINLNDIIIDSAEYTSAFYRCSSSTVSSTITNKPVSDSNPFILDVESIKYSSSTDFIIRQMYIGVVDSLSIYIRFCNNGTWTNWEKLGSSENEDTKVTNTLARTTKAYVTGTTSSTTNTGTQVFDTGVYLDTTAGQITATTFKGNLNGTVNGKTVPSITYGTTDLTDGVSSLATGTLYFVYE